jgi:hypothetical protein
VARISAVVAILTDVNVLGIIAVDRISAVATVPTSVDIPSSAYVSNSCDIPAAAIVPAVCLRPVCLLATLLLLLITILFPPVLAILLLVWRPWCLLGSPDGQAFSCVAVGPFVAVDLSAVEQWNSLPNSLRAEKRPESFKKRLKAVKVSN